MTRTAAIAAALLLGTFASCASAADQHAPLIERMSDTSTGTSTNAGNAVAAAATDSASTFADLPRSQVGDTTRALLQLQADNSRPGTVLPMLGEAASRSYQRYLNSFDHPIPEYFEAALPNSKQGGGSR